MTLLNCTAKKFLGDAGALVLKAIGIKDDTESFIDAVKSGDPERITIESLRLATSLFALKCQCFTADTLVSTMDGERPISDLKVGDKVWSYNTETGETEAKTITAVTVTETDVIVHIRTSDGEDIETTMFHPFYVKNVSEDTKALTEDLQNDGEWKAASNLIPGDALETINGRVVYVTEVRAEKLPETINVYNLEIEDLHTYYVAGGVLVHNTCAENDQNDVNKGGSNNLNDLEPNQGYSSFEKMKKSIGDAGEGKDWHHIVEQSQIKKSEFAPEQIHNTNNIIAIDHATHMKITGYYNTKSFRFTGELSVREWLAGQSYEVQYNFGLDVLRKFGVI